MKVYGTLLPLLDTYMFNIRILRKHLNLLELLRSLGLPEIKMILDLVPPAKQNKLLILALFVNAPRTVGRKRSRVGIQIGQAVL